MAGRRSPGEDSRVLRRYLEEISRYDPLAPEREKELGRVIQDPATAEPERTVAVDELVRANLRFVVSYAKKFHSPDVAFIDLISEGNMGLLQAARRFDPLRNVKFITYAVWWVRQAIMHALTEQSGAMSLPHKKATLHARITRARDALARRTGHEPSPAEIAAEVDAKVGDVEALLGLSRNAESLSGTGSDQQERSLEETLEQTFAVPADEEMIQRSLIDQVRGLLCRVPQKERAVLCRRFGILEDGSEGEREPMTLQEIGEELHLSRERVRQIESQAIARIRRMTRPNAFDIHLN